MKTRKLERDDILTNGDIVRVVHYGRGFGTNSIGREYIVTEFKLQGYRRSDQEPKHSTANGVRVVDRLTGKPKRNIGYDNFVGISSFELVQGHIDIGDISI